MRKIHQIKMELGLEKILLKHPLEGGDIDIFISRKTFETIQFPSHYKCVDQSDYNQHRIFLRFDEEGGYFDKIDFCLDGLSYYGVYRLNYEDILKNAHRKEEVIFILDEKYQLLERFLSFVFFPWKRGRIKKGVFHKQEISLFLADCLGVPVDKIGNEQWIRRFFIRRSPLSYLMFVFCKKWHRWRHFKKRLKVAVIGLDGAGKTTTIQLLKERCGAFDVRVIYMGWKDFKNPLTRLYRFLKRQKSPSSNRSGNGGFSFFQLVGYFLELYTRYFLSYFSLRGDILLYDRYFYDWFAESRSAFIKKLFFPFIPEPDLLFFLSAPPEVLKERVGGKGELLAEKSNRLQELARRHRAVKIDTAKRKQSEVVHILLKNIFYKIK